MHADFPVVLDACVLANYGVCDLMLRLAEKPRLHLPRWSEEILAETRRTQVGKLNWPEVLADSFAGEMKKSFPEACITGHERHLVGCTNHPKDRHVLAAAIHGKAEVIVTFNLRDFRPEHLDPWGVVAIHPNEHLSNLFHINQGIVVQKLTEVAIYRKRTLPEHLASLSKSVPGFCDTVAMHLSISL